MATSTGVLQINPSTGLQRRQLSQQRSMENIDFLADMFDKQDAKKAAKKKADDAKIEKSFEGVENNLKLPTYREAFDGVIGDIKTRINNGELTPEGVEREVRDALTLYEELAIEDNDAYTARKKEIEAGLYDGRRAEEFEEFVRQGGLTVDEIITPEGIAKRREYLNYFNTNTVNIPSEINRIGKPMAQALIASNPEKYRNIADINNKEFIEIYKELSPQDKSDVVGSMYQSSPEIRKTFERELKNKGVDVSEMSDVDMQNAFIEDYSKYLWSGKSRGGVASEGSSDDGIFKNGSYTNKRYRLQPSSRVEEAQDGKAQVDVNYYDLTRLTSGEPDKISLRYTDGDEVKSIYGIPTSIEKQGDKVYVKMSYKPNMSIKQVDEKKVLLEGEAKTRMLNYLGISEDIHNKLLSGVQEESMEAGGKGATKETTTQSKKAVKEEEDAKTAQGGLKVGERRMGEAGAEYEYQGGDPADKSNWIKVK